MTDKSYSYQELHNLAQIALQDQPSAEESLLAVEQYCAALAAWLEPAPDISTGELSTEQLASEQQLSDEEIQELNGLHQAVLVKAATLLGHTASQLQNLQTKAKGIMAYVDFLPKKISVTKPHKG